MKILRNEDKELLKDAQTILENPGFAISVANYIGKPIEYAIDKIDSDKLNNAVQKALNTSLDMALRSLNKDKETSKYSNLKHKLLTVTSGGIGGAFGLVSLPIELPISTTLMLRSIADIAKSYGHNLNDREIQLSCLEVFSLGSSKSKEDDAGESVYFTARTALAYEMKLAIDTVSNMSGKALQDALSKGQLPILVKFINSIASRFGITVSEKLVVQTVPIIGAIGGASINLMFTNHFQNMAKGHFLIKKLENKYSKEFIQEEYYKLLKK